MDATDGAPGYMSEHPAAPGLRAHSPEKSRRSTTWAGIVLALGGVITRAEAGDWPQILGPARNGAAANDERLAASWPASGPRVVWQHAVGSGFAGAAVVGQRVLTFYRAKDAEVLEALDATSGQPLWTQGHPTDFSPQYGSDDGPLCVP